MSIDTIDTDELLERFAWLDEDDLDVLADHPSLEPFIEPDDTDLSAAIGRWTEALAEAKAELRQRGEQVHPRMMTASGLWTTAIDPRRERSER